MLTKEDINNLMMDMISFDCGDARRIQHFMKVYEFAALIADGEGVTPELYDRTVAAAILHDIGIHASEEKYGDSSGKHQEELGPAYAEMLLKKYAWATDAFIDRVKYLIAHHHTYTDVDGLDYQILIEADFLVNSYEDSLPEKNIAILKDKIFHTKTGNWLLDMLYLKNRSDLYEN